MSDFAKGDYVVYIDEFGDECHDYDPECCATYCPEKGGGR